MAKQNLSLSYEPSLITYLSDVGTDVKNGASPLERLIKRKVLAPIATKSIELPKADLTYHIHLWVKGEAADQNHRQDQRVVCLEAEEENLHKNDFWN